ncbi:FAD/NAD-P-binding domain containing protein [Amanita muscaria]
MKLAVIGGGPSALYVTSRLLSLLKNEPNIRVHVYDRLWSPYGLVRYGVAPDHPEVKNCTHKFDETAKDPRFRFFGNVEVVPTPPFGSTPRLPSTRLGHAVQLPMSSILPHYTHLLLSTGCTLPTVHPTIPPSALCIPALSLVHWYTSHPSNPPTPPLHQKPHVSIIGAGNVSLDVARILLTPPSLLSGYDLPRHVLEVLNRSTVKHVSILARRGPLEAAFTAKELREMMNIPGTSMKPIPSDLLAPPPDVKVTRQQSRILQLLQKGSKEKYGTTEKTWSVDFFRSPTQLSSAAGETKDDLPLTLTLSHTALDPTTHASVPTGITSQLHTSLVVTSLGFQADPSSTPFYDPQLRRFRTLPGGRVVENQGGRVIKNVYGSGWAAGGAKGVLASTMMDAYNVAETMVEDLVASDATDSVASPSSYIGVQNDILEIMNPSASLYSLPPEIASALPERKVVEFKDWKKVDGEEVKRGQESGKERERMGWEEVKDFLGLKPAWK